MPEIFSTPDAKTWTPVPILMYHAVETLPRPPKYKHFYVLADEFAGQMRMLRRAGYQPVSCDLLAQALRGEAALPKKPALLTFDDGYQNLLSNVHPLLKEIGFPYTVFLVSQKIGKTNDWVAPEGYEPTPLLSWDEILQMQASGGVDFQAHTASHRHLNRLTQNEIAEELVSSRDALQQKLQKSVTAFCYPYGAYNAEAVECTREAGYTLAVTTEFGRVRAGDDPLLLPRISVYHVPPVSLTYGIGSLNFRWRLESRKDTRP